MEKYLKIQNAIVDKLSIAEFAGADFRIINAVLRRTNGWNKDEDWISLTRFGEITGLAHKTVVKSLQRLSNASVLLVTKGKQPSYKLNEKVDDWVVTKRELVTNCTPASYQTVPRVVTKRKPEAPKKEPAAKAKSDPKYTITKDTITKDILSSDNTQAVSSRGEFGNVAINELVAYFQGKLGASLDQSVISNRRQCYNLLRKFKKDYPGQDSVMLAKRLIDVALADDFHGRNATSFGYLYRNALKIITSGKPKEKGIIAI